MNIIDPEKLKVVYSFLLSCLIISAFLDRKIGIYFFDFFIIGSLISATYGVIFQRMRKIFPRPFWLEILYLIVIFVLFTSLLAKAHRLGDANIVHSINFLGVAGLGTCVAIEALLGILGFKIDIDVKGKLGLAFVGLGGLLGAGIGIAVLMGWDGPWGSG